MDEDYKNRVTVEKYELDGRIERLEKFTAGDIGSFVDQPERSRLDRQLMAMRGYSAILGERITAFGGPVNKVSSDTA